MKARLVTLGETMGLMTPAGLGGIEHAHNLELRVGGAESNVAIGFCRLGGVATWVGRVGDDALGRRVARELRGEGVDVREIVDRTAPTGLMLKDRPTPTVSRVVYYRAHSAGKSLNPEDVQLLPLEDAAVLHVTGITPALSSTSSEAIDVAIIRARDAGVPVAFDVNHRASLWSDRDARPTYRKLASQSDIVFAGVEEARLLVGDHPIPQLASRIADMGPSQVLVKRGAEGCFARVDAVEYHRSALPVVPVDTVGAGDAFVAGYLSALVAGANVSERLDLATKAGAFACLGFGDWESLPRSDDLTMLDGHRDPVRR